MALTRGESLGKKLQACAESAVRHLRLAFAGLFTASGEVLDLVGCAGDPTSPCTPGRRLPIETFEEVAAATREGALLSCISDLLGADTGWAIRSGHVDAVAFPLRVETRDVGLFLALSTRLLPPETREAIESVADEIALGIDHGQTEDALRRGEMRVRAMIDSMFAGVVVVDERFAIEDVNLATERIFGYSSSDLLGRRLDTLMEGSTLQKGHDSMMTTPLPFGRARRGGRPSELMGRRKSGQTFPLEVSIYQFASPDGPRLGVHLMDVSERREVERLKKEFVSTVSHELRTPLTSVRGSLTLFREGVLGVLPDEAREVVEVAERNTIRLTTLINDILDLERLESGRLDMLLERTSLDTVVARALEAVGGTAAAKEITIEAPPTGLFVHADGDRLVQVLVNLLSNAVKFSPAGSPVRIKVKELLQSVEVRVIDEGRGIQVALRDAVFERFRQVDASDDRRRRHGARATSSWRTATRRSSTSWRASSPSKDSPPAVRRPVAWPSRRCWSRLRRSWSWTPAFPTATASWSSARSRRTRARARCPSSSTRRAISRARRKSS